MATFRAEMKSVPLEQLSFDSFAKLLNTRFRVWIAANEMVELELIEATAPRTFSPAGGKGPAFEIFSLVFLGPGERVLPQRSYPFESDQAGRFELFIVPIGRDEKGVKYEAAFNRRVERGA
jgi:hypothetical protein